MLQSQRLMILWGRSGDGGRHGSVEHGLRGADTISVFSFTFLVGVYAGNPTRLFRRGSFLVVKNPAEGCSPAVSGGPVGCCG